MIRLLQIALWARDLHITVLGLSSDYKIVNIRYEEGKYKKIETKCSVEHLLEIEPVQPACWFRR